MKAALIVAAREVQARRSLLLAAALAAALSLLAGMLPGLARADAADARVLAGGVFGLAFSTLLAFALGFTMLGPDLAAGRLGFYLTRPLDTTSLWTGKVVGNAVLVMACALVAAAPAAFLSRGSQRLAWGMPLALVAGLALGLVVLGHAVSVLTRSRSPWLVADAVALLAVLAGGAFASQRIGELVSYGAERWVAAVLAGLALVALLLAGGIQLATGRADLRRGHRALSLGLWGVLLPVSLGTWGFGAWLGRTSPTQLDQAWPDATSTSSSWLSVRGTREVAGLDVSASFLLDADTGRHVLLGGAPSGSVAFSADGRWAAWFAVERHGDELSGILERMDLSATARRPEGTLVTVTDPLRTALALSPDGSTAAIAESGTISVLSLPEGSLLATRHVEGPTLGNDRLVFTAAGELLGLHWTAPYPPGSGGELKPELTLARWHTGERGLAVLGSIPMGDRFAFERLSPDGRRLLLSVRDAATRLVDVATATVLAELEPGKGSVFRAGFLADGRIVSGRSGDAAALVLRSADGAEEGVLPLNRAGIVSVGDQPSASSLLVRINPLANPGVSSTVLEVDLATGGVREVARDVYLPLFMRWGDPRPPEPGSVAARLLVGSGGAVEVLGPEGDLRVIAGHRRD